MPRKRSRVDVIIPALNEEQSIGLVAKDLQATAIAAGVDLKIIVGDNGSTDKTAAVAMANACIVVSEAERGYGAACLRALTQIDPKVECILFIDADHSDLAEEFPGLVEPILRGEADIVIGSRTLCGKIRERGSLTPQQKFGNWLATSLIQLFFGHRYTDLGPFRAISPEALQRLHMADRNFGWTVEMQIRAIKKQLRIREIPVSYRRRIGQSKVSGTIKGSILAGYIIIRTIFRELIRR
jgi:glycosyltransferase involved in cell wall biosynthesis